jgi:hypothetical protein
MKRVLTAMAVAGVLALMMPTVSAQKGGGKGKGNKAAVGTLALDQANPSLGDAVSFSWSIDSNNLPGNPLISVHCYHGGEVVYGETHWAASQNFVLGGHWGPGERGATEWMNEGGAADCAAVLKYYDSRLTPQTVVVATVLFVAEG